MTRHISLALALATLLGSTHLARAQQKTGIIDLKKCFDNYWKTKQADTNLKERAADLDKARKGMIDDFQKSNDEYKKLLDSANDQAVAAAERDKRKKAAEDKLLEIRNLEQNIQAFDRQARTTLGDNQRRMRDNILKEIRDIVNAKAKAKGFSAVFDTAAESANQTPIMLYTNGENDITDEVVKDLNAAAPAITPTATTPAPEPAPAPATTPAPAPKKK
jgi:outer membrane protein